MRCTRPSSAWYLVEVFAPYHDVEAQRADAERLDAAATSLTARGTRLRHLQSVFLPDEETAFHLFEAEQEAAVEQALRDADVEAERISPAIAVAGNGRGEAPAPAIGSGSRGLPGR